MIACSFPLTGVWIHRHRYLLRSGDRQGAYGFGHVSNHPDCHGSIALIRTLTRSVPPFQQESGPLFLDAAESPNT